MIQVGCHCEHNLCVRIGTYWLRRHDLGYEHMMNYWIDLFTGTTWDEFRKAGAKVSGFRERTRASAARVKGGDIFLCYLTGVMRWVGALRVIGGLAARHDAERSDDWHHEVTAVRHYGCVTGFPAHHSGHITGTPERLRRIRDIERHA